MKTQNSTMSKHLEVNMQLVRRQSSKDMKTNYGKVVEHMSLKDIIKLYHNTRH